MKHQFFFCGWAVTAGGPGRQGGGRQQTPPRREAHSRPEAASAAVPPGALAAGWRPSAGRCTAAASWREDPRGGQRFAEMTGREEEEEEEESDAGRSRGGVRSCWHPTGAPRHRGRRRRRVPGGESGGRGALGRACTGWGSQREEEEGEGRQSPGGDMGRCQDRER